MGWWLWDGRTQALWDAKKASLGTNEYTLEYIRRVDSNENGICGNADYERLAKRNKYMYTLVEAVAFAGGLVEGQYDGLSQVLPIIPDGMVWTAIARFAEDEIRDIRSESQRRTEDIDPSKV